MITPDSFARITADTSDHRLPVGTVVAVTRVSYSEDPRTGRTVAVAIVQPGGLAVYTNDLEEFSPLGEPADPVEHAMEQALQSIAADPDLAAAMDALDALFTQPAPEGTYLEAPKAPEEPVDFSPAQSGAVGTAEAPKPAQGPETPHSETRRMFTVKPGDAWGAPDKEGDRIDVSFLALLCGEHGFEAQIIVKTDPNGHSIPFAQIPEVIGRLQSHYRRALELKAQAERDGLI